MQFTVLFNPKAGTTSEEGLRSRLASFLGQGEHRFYDVTAISDYPAFLSELPKEDPLLLCGGDGTLNCFVNKARGAYEDRTIYYLATGTGNDFLKDIGGSPEGDPVEISAYLKHLPRVRVNGNEYLFLNNVGFGIDGYCTEEGDRQRASGKEKVNYTSIAIKGMLGKFRPVNAKVMVDDVKKQYKKAWLCPTMQGRFYGGGMMPTPEQDRMDPAHRVSFFVMHGAGKLKTLIVFPKIFKGSHLSHTEMCECLKGTKVKVAFDRPCALQIDGETILNVSRYEVDAS